MTVTSYVIYCVTCRMCTARSLVACRLQDLLQILLHRNLRIALYRFFFLYRFLVVHFYPGDDKKSKAFAQALRIIIHIFHWAKSENIT
jgi:hypothetical protein